MSMPTTTGGTASMQVSEPGTPYETSLATSIASLPTKSSFEDRKANWRFGTICATTESKDQYGASSTPIYQTATFKGLNGEYDYTRSGNPTRTALETQLARLYACSRTFAVSTGMTALDVILRLVAPGDTVVAGDDIYGGTDRLLTYMKTNLGVDVQHIDMASPQALQKTLHPGNRVKMVLVESPTNPLLKIADIQGISDMVHAGSPDALVVVDNTMMSPYLQRPLNLGADIVYDSGTKYLSGHHDLMAGIIAVEREDVGKRVGFLVNSVGSGLAPFDSFLLLRGLKTLSIRLDRQSLSASMVAAYLDALGFHVNFPGLKSHPNRDLHYKQADGAGAVLSFTTGDVALSERIVGGTRLWGISVSFGCVNSLISMPCVMSHASISADKRAERGLPENLIRLCVGIEDPRDLLDDLEHSLLQAGAIYPRFDNSAPATPTSSSSQSRLFDLDKEGWAVERAKQFKRSNSEGSSGGVIEGVKSLVDGVKGKLGLDEETTTAGPDKELIGAVKEDEEILVSAPGKVILFGEHAVVHGATAIAAAINLRCFALLSKRADGVIGVDLPDIGLIKEFEIPNLPWDAVDGSASTAVAAAPADLDQGVLSALERYLGEDGLKPAAHVAALAILYLYMVMSADGYRPGINFCARSALPIGAGLGSSASYSTCVAAAFLRLHNRISVPLNEDGAAANPSISAKDAALVDQWAFLAEKINHGNPSGIDNAVAVRGGAVSFARAINGRRGGMASLEGSHSVRLLLTDTKVPRDTKTMVAGVTSRLANDPERTNATIEAIHNIAERAKLALTDDKTDRAEIVKALAALIDENHDRLVDLGVSHPSLESVRAKTASEPYQLSTKLTGAGGGGCAVTLIPDSFPDASLNQLISDLVAEGFVPYLTSVGGAGLGIMRKKTPAGTGQSSHALAASLFRQVEASGLAKWAAESGGEWVHT